MALSLANYMTYVVLYYRRVVEVVNVDPG